MIKNTIKDSLIKANKGKLFISPNKLCLITGFGTSKVANLLAELDYISDNKGKMYFIDDVAEQIARRRQ